MVFARPFDGLLFPKVICDRPRGTLVTLVNNNGRNRDRFETQFSLGRILSRREVQMGGIDKSRVFVDKVVLKTQLTGIFICRCAV